MEDDDEDNHYLHCAFWCGIFLLTVMACIAACFEGFLVGARADDKAMVLVEFGGLCCTAIGAVTVSCLLWSAVKTLNIKRAKIEEFSQFGGCSDATVNILDTVTTAINSADRNVYQANNMSTSIMIMNGVVFLFIIILGLRECMKERRSASPKEHVRDDFHSNDFHHKQQSIDAPLVHAEPAHDPVTKPYSSMAQAPPVYAPNAMQNNSGMAPVPMGQPYQAQAPNAYQANMPAPGTQFMAPIDTNKDGVPDSMGVVTAVDVDGDGRADILVPQNQGY